MRAAIRCTTCHAASYAASCHRLGPGPARRMRQGSAQAGAATAGGEHRHRPAARRRHLGRVHRADAELAVREHPGAGVGLARQARLHRGRVGQGRAGAVPHGPEALPGAAGCRQRRVAAQPGRAAGGHRQPEPHQAAGGEERAVAEGPGRCAGPVRAGGGRSGAVEGAGRVGQAGPGLHRHHLAGHAASAAMRPWPTAPTSARRTAS